MTPHRQFGRPWVRLAAALVPTFLLALLLTNGSVSVAIRLEAALVLIVTLVRPAIGLMIVAFLAPLGDVVVRILDSPPRHAETLVVAFLAGWLLSRTDRNESHAVLPASLTDAMWVFGGVLIASVTATALQLHQENPAALYGTLATVTQSYLLGADDPIGIHAAGRLLVGLGLMAAAAEIGQRETRDRLWLLACLVASGVLASIASGLLAIGVAPAQTLARQAAVGLARYSAVTSDVNAAASSYLLLAGVSLGLATCGRRARPVWLVAAAIILSALTLTGSGAAVISGAVVVSAGLIWAALSASRRWTIVVTVALVLVVGGAIAFARTPRSVISLEMRVGFSQASLRLIEASPVFGIGVGRYYPMSKLVLPPWMSLLYASENAHNYYLQIAAEVGIVGAVAFVWILGGALSTPLKRVWRGRGESVMVGCVGGALAYLVTALSGHPFLVPETAIPFWIVLGLLVTPSSIRTVRPAWRGRAAIGFACALLLTAPIRGTGRVRLPPGDYGFGPWQTDDSGRPFREAQAAASLFVGPTARSVEIPMRLRGDRPGYVAFVGVIVPGSFGHSGTVGSDWTTQLVPLPGADALEPGQRINLAIRLYGDGAPGGGTRHVDVGQIRVVSGQ
jgi:O-antigen ligase